MNCCMNEQEIADIEAKEQGLFNLEEEGREVSKSCCVKCDMIETLAKDVVNWLTFWILNMY